MRSVRNGGLERRLHAPDHRWPSSCVNPGTLALSEDRLKARVRALCIPSPIRATGSSSSDAIGEGGQRHVSDILPERKAVGDREPEMDAAVNAAHAVLNGRLGEVVKLAYLARQGGAGRRERDIAEEASQHVGSRHATGGMAGDVVGEVRGDQERGPSRISAGG